MGGMYCISYTDLHPPVVYHAFKPLLISVIFSTEYPPTSMNHYIPEHDTINYANMYMTVTATLFCSLLSPSLATKKKKQFYSKTA